MAVLTVEGRRVYVKTEYNEPAVARLKELGANWDPQSRRWWVGLTRRAEVEAALAVCAAQAAEGTEPVKDEPDSARCLAKVSYKGKSYYVLAESLEKGRCKICRLTGLGFWVDMADCELIKTYHPRPFRDFRGRPVPGRLVHTTLGSIRAFVKEQKEAEARGKEPCAACGKRGLPLQRDLEDGLLKCRACCDIPED